LQCALRNDRGHSGNPVASDILSPENLALQRLFFIFCLDNLIDAVMGAEVFFGRRSLKFYCPSSVGGKFLKYFRSNFEVSLLWGICNSKKSFW
jgi:hypothetical protein